ncbi:hypothetical protein PSYPI_41598, partial [Pseudomonas syringae pv. pisi str. 1704B]
MGVSQLRGLLRAEQAELLFLQMPFFLLGLALRPRVSYAGF